MISLTDLLILGLVSGAVSAFVAAFIGWIVRSMCVEMINSTEQKWYSFQQAQKGAIGNQKQAEQKARLNEAAGRLTQLALEAKAAGSTDMLEIGKKIVPQVMMEYPDVALQIPALAMKMSKGL